jgi:hypothetical protein
MDLRNDDLKQIAAADRREVNPQVPVEIASWTRAGQLDWWVKERREWWGRVAVLMAVNGGLELLIFVSQAAYSGDFLL